MDCKITMDLKPLAKALDNYERHVMRMASLALEEIAKSIMEDSKANYCPVVTGRLRASGKVRRIYSGSYSYTVDLAYDAPYAWMVHERPANIGQGKNKYLEKPFLKVAGNLSGIIAAKIGTGGSF